VTIDSALAELIEAAVAKAIAPLAAEVRALRAEREHSAGHWGSRAEAAQHLDVGLDAVDAMIARRDLRVEKLGPEPKEDRRDKLGRRVDRRRVRVWLTGAPKSDAEIQELAEEARQ
jgi:hypothetical protein